MSPANGDRTSDPGQIGDRAQLAAALKTIKGERSYAKIKAAANTLCTRYPKGGRPEQRWSPQPLAKSTLTDWFSSRSLPTQDKLRTFLSVCGVSGEQWPAWEQKVDELKKHKNKASTSRSITELHPIRHLRVSEAIYAASDVAQVVELSDLTPYVERAHDHRLREALRTGQGNQLLILVGDSSTGKTRACYEAVCAELPGWPVLRPTSRDELLTLLEAGVKPGTVLWLNETQHYIRGPRGADVGIALHRLLDTPSGAGTQRVVAIGSMWLHEYWIPLTRQPQHHNEAQEDPYLEVRELLTLPGVKIPVAADFTTATDRECDALRRAAEQDPRLRAALAAGGERLRIIQNLTGGPQLLNRYHVDLYGTPGHAILTAAMDAWRIGYESPLPATMLEQAVTGYLTDEQRAGSLAQAFTDAAERVRGVCALTPVRTATGVGESDAYVLHDYFAQHALGPRRRRDPIPSSVWDAVTAHPGAVENSARLADNAARRLLYRYAIPLYRHCDNVGDPNAARQLAGLLAQRGDVAKAIAILRAQADTDDADARWELASLLAEQGQSIELRARAHAGDPAAAVTWAKQLTEQGKATEATALFQTQADAGNRSAAIHLARLLLEQKFAELRARPDAGDPAVERDQMTVDELRAHADAGNPLAMLLLVEMLAERGDIEELRARGDSGNVFTKIRFAMFLAERGDIEELRARADSGDFFAGVMLASLPAEHGEVAELRVRADDHDPFAMIRLAALLAEQGDIEGLQAEVHFGSPVAAQQLVELLAVSADMPVETARRMGLTPAAILAEDLVRVQA
jgi:hypothetical protein